MRSLTPRQLEVYSAIREYIQEHGETPGLKKLAARCGMASTNTVRRHLSILAEKGLVHPRRFRVARDIRLLDQEAA